MSEAPAVIAAAGPLELIYPDCEKGTGAIIRTPEARHLIEGVRIQPVVFWPDDRGYFLELLRLGEGLVGGFAPETTQVSAALSYPGTVKAFHYHLLQTDLWVPAMGMLQVALVDLRRGSRTFGARNTLYVGVLRPWQLSIPPGVGHGYKVIGTDPAMLLYVTDRFYDPDDEGRIPHNHPRINYDWETQFK